MQYSVVIVRPAVHQQYQYLAPVVTLYYPELGYITPIDGRWHVSPGCPRLGHDQWVDPLSVSDLGYDNKRDALDALLAECWYA